MKKHEDRCAEERRSEMLINIVVNIRFKSKKSAEQTSRITLYFG